MIDSLNENSLIGPVMASDSRFRLSGHNPFGLNQKKFLLEINIFILQQ